MNPASITIAAEIKARAERRAGELLREMPKRDGARGVGRKVDCAIDQPTPTLTSLGITHRQSSFWQKLAATSNPRAQRCTG
jgi:hypothetical protein